MKHYWLVFWLERWTDGTVKAFKTAVHCETLTRAATLAHNDIFIRSRANDTEFLIYSVGLADADAADLIGKAETDALGIDWPE